MRRSLTRGQEKNNKKLVGKARGTEKWRRRQRGKREEIGRMRVRREGGEGERRGRKEREGDVKKNYYSNRCD